MHRLLSITLPARVRRDIEKAGVPFIAESIGCAPATLRKILEGQWDYVHRSVLERLLDHYQLEVSDLFTLTPSTFWTPFERTPCCTILTGAQKSPLFGADLPVINELIRSIPQFVNGCGVTVSDVDLSDPVAVSRQVSAANTILVGSPRSNPATEIILSECLDTKRFRGNESGKKKMPFRFVWPEHLKTAADAASQFSEWSESGFGIVAGDPGKFVAAANYRPREAFFREAIWRANDCALVVVQNRQSDGSKAPRKTIVLAGFTSLGTLAAVRALIRDFRRLEPKEKLGTLIGILTVTYKKTLPHADNREITKIDWRYLEGGRETMSLRFEK